MSESNLLGFSSSLGIYRNKRLRDLRGILLKQIPVKAPFAELSTTLFQVLMAYAGEHQIDGDFRGYTSQDLVEIFASNHFNIPVGQASAIRKAFGSVGLIQEGKIRSWSKFNRHFAEYEKILSSKRKAAKQMHQKRQREAREEATRPGSAASKNGENPAAEQVQKPVQKDSPSKALWVLDQALKAARGRARKALLVQRQELLSDHTGVDLSTPTPSPAPSSPAAPKQSAKEREESWDRGMLAAGKQAIEDGTPEILTDSMVRAMVNAGYRLPAQVASRFRKLVKEVEADENPVPE